MQAVLAVTTAAARALSNRDQAECRLATQSLPMVATCLTANHKELPATALSCLDAMLGERVTARQGTATIGPIAIPICIRVPVLRMQCKLVMPNATQPPRVEARRQDFGSS